MTDHFQLLPDEDRIQALIKWAYREMDPQKQLDSATEFCEALKNAVSLEDEGLVSPAKVDELVRKIQPHLLFLLNSVRSTTVRTYAARAFGYECKRERLNRITHHSLTSTLLNTIKQCVERYQERQEKEIKDKCLSLIESCLWPLTECMKDQTLRNQIIEQLATDESLLQHLLFLIQIDHTGTKTNLFALLIRMLKEDAQNGDCWQMLQNLDFGEKIDDLLQEHESFQQGEPDWIRNLKTLDRLMKKRKKPIISPISKQNSKLEKRVLESCREMGVEASLEQVRAGLAKAGRSSNDMDKINAAIAHVLEPPANPKPEPKQDPLLKQKSFDPESSWDIVRQPSNQHRQRPDMHPHQSHNSSELMFVGLQSDPVCFDRIIPDSLNPAVLDFGEEETVIQEAIRTSQYNFSWCFDVLTLNNFFKVIYRCNILHISGHGHQSKFMVEDGFGTVQIIPASRLEKVSVKGRRAHHLRIVFVSMCHSGDVAEKFVEMGVPHVVAVNNDEKVKDQMAIKFAEHFYNLFFAQGQSISEAFEGAQQFCSVNFPSSKSPLILLPKDGNHDVTCQELFEPVCPGMLMDSAASEENLRTFKRTPSNNIPTDRGTIGRHLSILKGFCFLYKLQQQNRIVIYHGAPHVGKRTVVGLTAFTVHRLKKAQDGVLYVPFMKQVESLEEFVKRIFDEIHRLSLDGRLLDGINNVEPTAESVLQYLLQKNMCIFFVCERGMEISDWIPEDDDVLHEVVDFIHRLVKKGNPKLKFVICVSKPGLDRLQSCGEYWSHLPEVQVKLMDLIQAKTLVKKSVIKLVGESKAREHSHKINSSGIFKEEFGLPLSPRIIEKLVLLFCRRGVSINFLTRVLRSPRMGKLLKIAEKQFPQAVDDLKKWKTSIEELQSYVKSGYYARKRG